MTATPARPLQALLGLFIASLLVQPLIEPDFGWHLRSGLDLIQNGWRVPAHDPYSHTMPDWPWVNHAWLTDGFLGVLYRSFGDWGPLALIAAFALVTGMAFWLAAGISSAGRTSRLLALSVTLWVGLPFLGARTQVVSLLGMALLLLWWDRYGSRRASGMWMLPGLFLLWANLHGGFTAGLFTLGVLLATSILRVAWRWGDEPVLSWPEMVRFATAIGLAALVTLANPYGWRLHEEILSSLTDRFMLETLHEWQPLSLETRAGRWYVAYLALLAAGLAFGCRRREPVRWLLLLVFLIFSLRHLRNIPFFLLLSVSLLADMFDAVFRQAGKAAAGAEKSLRAWRLTGMLMMAALLAVLGPDHWQSVMKSGLAPREYFRATDYPIEAVEWISTHRDRLGSRLFNPYGIGGFLLWWLPDLKIFIDGRMPAWRIGDRWIFYDYVAVTAWEPVELGVLAKYDVDWAIVETDSALAGALEATGLWDALYRDAKVIVFRKQTRA
jgi:hypothetical protein